MSDETLEQRAARLLDGAKGAADAGEWDTANELTLVALDAIRDVLANAPEGGGAL